MKNIIYTKKIIFKFFTFIVFFILFFIFIIPKSSAQVIKQKVSDSTFKTSKKNDVGYIDTLKNTNGNIKINNKVKVCKDISCINPGIIDFGISGNFPLIVDTTNGLSGKVYGNELGWITFNPPYGGVFFANPATGLLKGTAWSETSGAINFSVTGQKVIINPNTGEWKGWAWASGPYGGWIKFDCKDASCVKTTWRGQNNINSKNILKSTFSSQGIEKNTDTSWSINNFGNFYQEIVKVFRQKNKIIKDDFNIFFSTSADFFNKIGQITNNTYNSATLFLENIFKENLAVMPDTNHLSKQPTPETKTDNNYKKIEKKISEKNNIDISNVNKTETPTSKKEGKIIPIINNYKNITSNIVSPIKQNLNSIKNTPVKTKKITNYNSNNSSSDFVNLYQGTIKSVKEKTAILSEDFNVFISSSTDLLNKTGEIINNTYNSIASYVMKFRDSILRR